MKLACPACGALMSLDVVVGHDGAREAVQTALQLPAPLGKLLIQYVALFRPRTRQLTLDRLATLLGELLVMIEAQRVRFDGQEVAAPQSIWVAALQDMVDRDKSKPFDRPLGNHNYLLQIVCSTSRRLAAVAETRREEQRRQQPEGRRTGQRTARDTALGAVALLRGALASQPPTEESGNESD